MRFRAWCEEHNVGLDVLMRDAEMGEQYELTWDYVYKDSAQAVKPEKRPGEFVLHNDHFCCPNDEYGNCVTKWKFTPYVAANETFIVETFGTIG